jgi:uncharacterized protein (DUF1015 family)
MVVVKSFKGITYNSDKFDNLDDLFSPPYDIISETMRDQLYNKNEYNFVRLILGEKKPNDDINFNCYTRARDFLENWISRDILIKSKNEAIYPYKINYKINNEKKTMNGFFILLKIDKDYIFVRAHEKTLSKPKEDRLNLLRETASNLEPIQLLYIDEKDEINQLINQNIHDPEFEINGYDSFKHKLWKLDDKELISKIKDILKDQVLFIADGHHRYQTSINYANEMKKKSNNSSENPFDYRMVILVNMFDEGLSILPTHRLIKKDNIDFSRILKKINENFDLVEKKFDDSADMKKIINNIKNDITSNDFKKFVLYLKNRYYILTLKNLEIMDNFTDEHSNVWKSLDVTILQKLILEEILDINQNNLEEHVFYTRDDLDALNLVNQGKYDLSFILNPTKISELKQIAENGEHMPQKSTYFLPKMLSGLVLYKM